ncbi:MAG: 6-phosphogluconolactonase [Micrococcales bacterium]|nr:6-phosphogluconolactonase [Micrococcales bacterium]
MTQLLVGVHPDADAVSEAVANRMAAAIIRTLSKSDYAHICITGGRGGHGALANLAQDAGIDWSRVHVVVGRAFPGDG